MAGSKQCLAEDLYRLTRRQFRRQARICGFAVFEDHGQGEQTADRAESPERNESNHQDWHNPTTEVHCLQSRRELP
jgi:hypothetical protein